VGQENDLDLISLSHSCHSKVRQVQGEGIDRLTPNEIAALNPAHSDTLTGLSADSVGVANE